MTIFTPWSELQIHIDCVLETAESRPGYIFNLGHGIHRSTPADIVKRLVEHVHEWTRNQR